MQQQTLTLAGAMRLMQAGGELLVNRFRDDMHVSLAKDWHIREKTVDKMLEQGLVEYSHDGPIFNVYKITDLRKQFKAS